jgi:hypothetical protein
MVLGLVAAGAVMALFYWTAIWCGEPRYKGRTLTHWLAVYQKAQVNTPEEREAADAVRKIGTNALPYLLARLTYQMPAWRLKAVSAARHLPGPAEKWATSLMLGEDHLMAAASGFSLLGAQAAPAVPELVRLLGVEETLSAAKVVLLDIGKAAIPGLVAALTNRSNPFQIRVCAADLLGSVNVDSVDSRVVTVLASCLQDDPQVAEQAAATLARWNLEPTIAVPALMNAAGDGYYLVREKAIWALERFGTNALPAVPVLTNLLADPNPVIREATTNALEAIAPEVLGTNSVSALKAE